MISIPVTSKSVYIPLIQTGFLKYKFDSTYPIQLNGIINQVEFQESIHRINRRITSNELLIVLAIVLGAIIISGLILFGIDGITEIHFLKSESSSFGNGIRHSRSNTSVYPPLIAIGIALFVFGILFTFIVCCMLQSRREEQIRQAIAEESMKYTSRSPKLCSWRLEINKLVIDIGHPTLTSHENRVFYLNQAMSESPTGSIEEGTDHPPPPYSG